MSPEAQALEREYCSGIVAVPLYVINWLGGLIAMAVLAILREETRFFAPLTLIFTFGVLVSYQLAKTRPSLGFRAAMGCMDALVGVASLSAQSVFNNLVGIPNEPSYEILISTSLTWYIVLRSFFMVVPSLLLWQNVPLITLFGLVSNYSADPKIGYFFAIFLCLLVYSLIYTHYLSMQADGAVQTAHGLRRSPVAITARYTVYGFVIVGLGAFLLLPVLDLFVGRLVVKGLLAIPLNRAQAPSFTQETAMLEVGLGPVTLSDQPVLRVAMTDKQYVREDVLTVYTGRGWSKPSQQTLPQYADGETPIGYNINNWFMPPPESSHEVHQQVRVVRGLHRYLYYVGYVSRVKTRDEQVFLELPTRSLTGSQPFRPGEEYKVWSYVVDASPAQLRRAEPNMSMRFLQLYTQLPGTIPDRLRQLAFQLTHDTDNDYDRVIALKVYIEQQCKYNLSAAAFPAEGDVVDYFVFEGREGYCDAFATSLAVMCRIVGIPARVVRGYLPKVLDEDTNEYVLRDSDKHLWTEVFFENYGWVRFDATEGAEVVQLDALGSEGDSAVESAGKRSSIGTLILQWTINLLIVGLVGYLIWSELLPRLGWRTRPAYHPHTQAQRLYQQFSRLLAATGLPAYTANLTPREYWFQVESQLPLHWTNVRPPGDEFLATFQQARYAPDGGTTEQIDSLNRSLTSLKREVTRHVPLWRLWLGYAKLAFTRGFGR